MNDIDIKLAADNRDEVLSVLVDKIQTALEAVGLQAEGNAKLELENDPRRIDTGRLRNSITHTVDDNTVYIGTNVEYGIYVHEGTTYPNGGGMRPNRFLKNALADHTNEYEDIIKDYLTRG